MTTIYFLGIFVKGVGEIQVWEDWGQFAIDSVQCPSKNVTSDLGSFEDSEAVQQNWGGSRLFCREDAVPKNKTIS